MKTVLVFSAKDNPWVARKWLRGFCRYARAAKWRLVHSTRLAPGAERRRLKGMIEFLRPDGIVSSYTEGVVGNVPPDLPVAWLDVDAKAVGASAPLVRHDGTDAVTAALDEFERLGVRELAVVGMDPDVRWSHGRLLDFRRAAVRRGHPVAVFEEPLAAEDSLAWQRRLISWLKRLPKPCGVFAANDRMASMVLATASMADVPVPADIAVIGVDNDEDICLLSSPTLTSVATDWEKGGFLLGEALDRRMRAPRAKPLRVKFGELGIIRRGSTTPGANRVDPRIAVASAFIREHACEGIGVADVVRQMGCSRNLAELRYLQATGRSIFAEIRETKFEQVLVLLARRDVSIRAISDMCGWKSPVALRTYFEKRLHMTMHEWRVRNNASVVKN